MGSAVPFSRWRPHPWHGLSPGPDPPDTIHAYVELTPFDSVKYEIDKATGYLKVDRPQRTSSQPPTLYGFVPRTYCGARVAALTPGVRGADGDPLDVCVISERPIDRGEIVLVARVLGGIQMIDRQEADDKIVAVLVNDLFWGEARSIEELPAMLIERLRHYFATYKMAPGEERNARLGETYARAHALEVVRASLADYRELIGSDERAEEEQDR